MPDEGLPYGRGPDGRPQWVVDAAEVPEAILLARVALGDGRVEEALALLDDRAMGQAQALLDGQPSRPGAMFLLGQMFVQLRRAQEAEACFERIIARQPHALVFYELGRLYRDAGLPSRATQCRRKAVALDPCCTEFRLGLALDLLREGWGDEGIVLLRQVVAEDPLNADARSKLLFYLHLVPGVTRQELFDEHRQWGRIHALPAKARPSPERDRSPDRRLRVGYVSADFRRHSVAYTFESLLEAHDPAEAEVYGYGHVAVPDEVTARVAGKFDHYRGIHGLADEAVADLIERDQIDILVGIASHTEGHRLGVLALKPSPIQVDLGSLGGTGLPQIDYRITDQWLDPPEVQPYYLEELVYVRDGAVCYRPPDFAPPVGPLPARLRGVVTFGSFNNGLKINPSVVTLWSEILRRVPDSRLLLKCAGGGDAEWTDRLREAFSRLRIDPRRIEICGRRSPAEHLRLYGQMDIALDPHPFNGCVSTLEALWMGVPVVTLAGDVFVSRMGATVLSCLGMEALVASHPDGYVAAAVTLAGNLETLERLRRSLRARMAGSPLCDGRRYARQIEAAYRRMWRRWCEGRVKDRRSRIRSQELKTRLSLAFGNQHSAWDYTKD